MFSELWLRVARCHGHTNHGLRQSTNDKAMNMELEVTRLGTLEVVSDETINLGS